MVMNKKVVKRIIYSISSLLLAVGLFVIADYYTLFGTTIEKKLEFAEIRIRTLDKDSGAIVMNVGVRCFQKNNMNACTRRESHQLGVVAIHVPVQRGIKKTILFEKVNEIYKAVDPEIHIMLMHQNYHNPTKTILMENVYSNKVSEYIIEMPPITWKELEEE